MNDFTKSELQTILSWGNVYTEFGQSWTFKMCEPLINKILFMINNYYSIDEIISQHKENIHHICELCGTWVDNDFKMHYVNPCIDGGHQWKKLE
jgi:hypothetical protein